jgi:hypothetical protein
MIIDLMKIGNIKSKTALKKYKLNKPLMNGNYLFHYLILTGTVKCQSKPKVIYTSVLMKSS